MVVPRNLTIKTAEALEKAHQLALEHGQQELSPLHLLLAILQQPDSIVPPLLKKLNIDLNHVDSPAVIFK